MPAFLVADCVAHIRAGGTDLWNSQSYADRVKAKHICERCPSLQACAAEVTRLENKGYSVAGVRPEIGTRGGLRIVVPNRVVGE
jgi:hypothetical protein